jgi:hypothetical protein
MQNRTLGHVRWHTTRVTEAVRGGLLRQLLNVAEVTSFDGIALRQCEWDGADGNKQKQIKRASNEMCFDVRIDLFLHFMLSSVER